MPVFYFFFTASKQGKTGLTVTVDVYNGSTGALLAANQAATEIGGGLYKLSYASTAVDLLAKAKTADTSVDLQHVAALVSYEQQLVDAATSTRATPAQVLAQIVASLSAIANAVWSALIAGWGAGTTGKKLESLCCPFGDGVNTFVYSVTDDVTGLPIQGVFCTVTTDAIGDAIVAQATTDLFGNVTFYLDSGTYYIWRVKTGYTFVNPDIEVIP